MILEIVNKIYNFLDLGIRLFMVNICVLLFILVIYIALYFVILRKIKFFRDIFG